MPLESLPTWDLQSHDEVPDFILEDDHHLCSCHSAKGPPPTELGALGFGLDPRPCISFWLYLQTIKAQEVGLPTRWVLGCSAAGPQPFQTLLLLQASSAREIWPEQGAVTRRLDL